MKNVTLLLLMALTFSSAATAQQRFTKNHVKANTQAASKHFIDTRGETTIFKPQTMTYYEYNEGQWAESMVEHYKYDKNGNITELSFEEGGIQNKSVYTYNENNKVLTKIVMASSDGGKTWVNSEKNEWDYDIVVPDFNTKYVISSWENDQWNIQLGNIFDITRNDNGNVTRMSIKSYFMGEYEEIEAVEVEYDTDGVMAKTWKHIMADYNDEDELVMYEAMRYDNIKWENTDGQILSYDENEFLMGNNRIKEATIYDEGVKTANFKTTYTNEKDFESIQSSVSGPDTKKHTLVYTDEYGSNREDFFESLDEDGNGTMEEYHSYQVLTCDSHGNLIKLDMYDVMEGEEELIGGSKTDYTYGGDGRTLEFTQNEWNYDDKVYEPRMRIVFSDFVEFTVMSITAQEHPALQYSVQGGLLTFSMEGAAHYAIYNVNGVQMMDKDMEAGSETVNISALPDGLYLLAIQGNEGIVRVKFMK